MKNLVTPLIIGIVTLILGILLTKYVFNDKIDLRFTLSDTIPINYSSDSKNENIQELTIKNVGDLVVNKIVVRIKRKIIEYDIQKYSMFDSVNVYPQNDKFELLYPALPPKGFIKIVLKSIEQGISNGQIEISHEKGEAISAFEVNKDNVVTVIELIMAFILLISFLFYIRETSIYFYLRKAFYDPFNTILKKRKPFYITEKKWNEIREESIPKIFEKTFYTLQNSIFMEVLESEKHKNISDDEWRKILILASEKFKDYISSAIFKSYPYFPKELQKLVMPKNIKQNDWEDILKIISKSYCLSILLDSLEIYKKELLIKKLEEIKIYELISEKDRDKIIETIRKIYFTKILDLLNREYKLIDLVNSSNLEILNEDQKHFIQDLVYNIKLMNYFKENSRRNFNNFLEEPRPLWLEETDYKNLYELASLIQKTKIMMEQYSNLFQKISKVLNGKKLSDLQDQNVSIENWEKLKDLEETILNQREEIESEKLEVYTIKNEFEPLKMKIEKQLNIIDQVLNKSDILDRLEDYSNPFSSGNLNNLKKLSEILRKS